jgi:hypothetical protein
LCSQKALSDNGRPVISRDPAQVLQLSELAVGNQVNEMLRFI